MQSIRPTMRPSMADPAESIQFVPSPGSRAADNDGQDGPCSVSARAAAIA